MEYAEFGIGTFKREICARLGDKLWNDMTDGICLPDINTEGSCGCANMFIFMKRLEQAASAEDVKAILCKVRHGLHPSQSEWARKEFLEVGNLDAFLKKHLEQELDSFIEMSREHKDFYGQYITDEVLEFVKAHPSMLAPERKGNKLYCTAFPCNMEEYLKAKDDLRKRYHACHCPFAKESILSENTVSRALCNCSLGHVMNFVEAFLGRELHGRVLSSVLSGDLLCRYEIDIPDDVMAEFVDN